MRNRLIELCENLILSCKAALCEDCEHNNIDYPHCMSVHFADYLLANGVIVPPSKVGDTVYQICNGGRIYESTIKGVTYDTNGIAFDERAIGKNVFLAREEAERVLAERKDK